MIRQSAFPPAPDWIDPGAPNLNGYTKPDRRTPGLSNTGGSGILVSVIGTVKNEAIPLERSLHVWSKQIIPEWLVGRIDFWVLDDGSSDNPHSVVEKYKDLGMNVRYARFREDGDGEDRSCTLLHNAAIKNLITAEMVLIQWWDRIPGSFKHLESLVMPHVTESGIITSAISRHIGGSSSVKSMTPEGLAEILGTIPWRDRPTTLELIAGPSGSHCLPGNATESSGMLLSVKEFNALGGYDERYRKRAGYVNVEFFRRACSAGLTFIFPDDTHSQNFHQSHAANRAKSTGRLADRNVVRNQDVDWGTLEPIDVW